MKILLACTTIEDGHRDETNQDSHYPLGLAYLQSYLEKHRPNKDQFVNLFLNNVDYPTCFKTLEKQFKEFQPEVVGISIMTHSRVSAFKIIEHLHDNYPHIKIVIGGMHASVLYEQLAKHYPYVIVVRGEGERTLHSLIEAWEKGESIADIRGLAYADGEDIHITPQAELIDDLDELPFPKHSLFVKDGKRMANLLTSRGCPFKCNFCVLDALSRRMVRFRSGENIADEVELLLKTYPSISTIWIHDDAFMIHRARTLEFCDSIINRGIKTQFIASARFRPINKEVVHKMKEAGFVQVLFGLESGAAEVMKGINKGIGKDDVRYGQKLFAEVGVKVTAFLIAGLPGETDETVEETIDFIQEIQKLNYLFYDDIGVAMIYPGTDIYRDVKLRGGLDDDFWLSDAPVPYYTTEYGGTESLEKLMEWKQTMREGIALKYMFNSPKAFLRQRKLIPEIIRYGVRFPDAGLQPLIQQVIQKYGEEFVNDLVSNFLLGDTEGLRKTFASVCEDLIASQIEGTMTSEDKNQFRLRLEDQIAKDEKILKDFILKSEHITVEDWNPNRGSNANLVADLPKISSAGGTSMNSEEATYLVNESGKQF